MKKDFIYFFIIIYVCYSCVSPFNVGVYNGENNSGNPNDFTFFEDSTFIYNYYGSIKKHSFGKYKIRDNKIILNSNIKNITVPVDVSTLICDSLIDKNRITFLLKLSEGMQEDYKCIPILNNDTLNNKEGIIYLTQGIQIDEKWGGYTMYYTEPIDSIKLYILKNPFIGRPKEPLMSETIYFDKVIEKDITLNITINDSLFGYRVFNNTMLEIKKKKIIFIDKEENKMNSLYLRLD